MPVTYRVDKAQRVVFATREGSLTEREELAFQRDLVKDADFEPSFDALCDYRGVTAVDLTPSSLEELAVRNPFGKDGRVAFVVSSNWLHEFGRLLETLSEHMTQEVRIFREMAEARRWLGLD